jgi:PAS domain S-box-containing protein
LLLSVSVGVGVWALDAVLDYLILGNRSFLDMLLFDVPLNSFCIRMVILVVSALFGLLIARMQATQKTHEAALKEIEERYHTLVETIPHGIQEMDASGIITFSNSAHDRLLGYRRGELIGKSVFDLEKSEAARAERRKHMQMLIQKQPPPSPWYGKDQTKDGNLIDIQVDWNYKRDRRGRVIGFISVISNITERKKLESRLQQAQKMEAIATLAGGIAQEFNDALTGIGGNVELLEMAYPDYPQIRKYIDPVSVSAQRMGLLTDQLLAYARGGKFHPKVISLSQLVRDTLTLIRHTLRPEIEVKTELGKDLPQIKADATQLQMVISAVVNNAHEAIAGTGGIRIVTRSESFATTVSPLNPEGRRGTFATLVIEDTGKGMDEKTRAKIFEPFFTTNFQGRGLGMAAVYGIVKNHGGWIDIDSAPGKGTAVRIFLPTVEAG